MGIELDWQVEAEQTRQQAQEDPDSKHKRHRDRMRLLMGAFFVGLVVCGVAAGLIWRLRSVDERAENNLRAAVDAELAAIRIGNETAFMNVQRSASDPWLESQRSSFAEYQVLKQAGRLAPQAEILDVLIEEERGRVIVQEIIDGVPYEQVWFYWRYDTLDDTDLQAGWRHVPPDVTFWGEQKTIENAHSSVTYYELDEAVAEALAKQVEQWWQSGCALLSCAAAPEKLEVIIDPQAGVRLAWEPDTGWRLRVISPLLNGRIPVSQAVPSVMEREVALEVAKRLIDHASGGRLQYHEDEANLITHDTTWVKYQLLEWLVAHFRGMPSPFLDSAVQVFGNQVPGNLVQTLTEGGQITAIAPALNPAANVLTDMDAQVLGQMDWRPFFEWRLTLERQRLQTNDLDNFFTLYESGNFNEVAQARAFDPAYRSGSAETVQQVSMTYRADGTLAALVEITDSSGSAAQTSFAWIGDTFLRVN